MREYTTSDRRNRFRNLLELLRGPMTYFGEYDQFMSKLTPKIILEGTRLTFKTDSATEKVVDWMEVTSGLYMP